MGILDGLTRRLRAADPLPLKLALDEREDGKHVVSFWLDLPSGARPVAEPSDLLAYGATIEVEGRRFRPSVAQLETIYALHSMRPASGAGGTWVFDVSPPVLAYLRERETVVEGPASRRIEIGGMPARPAVAVDFDPERGATVTAGYDFGDGRVVPADAIRRTPDGAHARIANRFVPLREPDAAVRLWLDRGTTTVPAKDVPVFFLRDLAALKGLAAVRMTPSAAEVEVVAGGAPSFVVDAGVPGWLDFDVRYGTAALNVPLPAAAAAAAAGQEFVEAAPGRYVRIDPAAVAEAEAEVTRLGATRRPEGGFRVPAERVGRLHDVISSLGGVEEVTAAYRAFLGGLTGLELDETAPLPEPIEAALATIGFVLRPYQRQGIQWLRWLADHGLHGLLADDMGLGKTVQAALAVRSAYETRPDDPPHTLVVCPRSVVENWAREFHKLFPALEVDVHLGDARELDDFRRTTPRIFITSYGTMTRDVDRLHDVELRYLILDEASQIKNPSAQRTKALKRLRARHRLCLTGTPVENRPSELWSLVDFLLPGHLGDRQAFDRMYGDPLVAGNEVAAERLSARLRPFLLRRRKEEVAKDLPEKIDVRGWCGLTPEQVTLYRRVLDGSVEVVGALERGERVSTPMSILPILTRLKQVCGHPALLDRPSGSRNAAEPDCVPDGGVARGTDDVADGPGEQDVWPGTVAGRSEKFDLALERIEEIAERGEKTIVFSQFLGMLDLLEPELIARGIGFVRIDGSTTERQTPIDRLNDSAEVKVALCSILATGYGINLQAANNVIHVDRWWNPAVEDQATARVHRIGQVRTVFVHHLLVRGTLEERIDWLLGQKRRMAAGVIDGGLDAELGWTREELLEILRPLDVTAAAPVESASVP